MQNSERVCFTKPMNQVHTSHTMSSVPTFMNSPHTLYLTDSISDLGNCQTLISHLKEQRFSELKNVPKAAQAIEFRD